MAIELSKDQHKKALASIVRYFQEHREEAIGHIAASSLLSFFLEEIGPSIYNKAIADVQTRMQMHVADLDVEFHEEEFQHWVKEGRKRKER